MTNIAEVVSFDEVVEDEVFLKIENIGISCYARYTNEIVKNNTTWEVEIIGEAFDEPVVHEEHDRDEGFYKINSAFSYEVVGVFNNNIFSSKGVLIDEEFLLSDFGYLEGKKVCWRIDRLEVEFLKKLSQ